MRRYGAHDSPGPPIATARLSRPADAHILPPRSPYPQWVLLACGSIPPSSCKLDTDALRSVVLVGGGTGSPHLLRAMRGPLGDWRRSIIVPVTDTGRSTGVVRRSFHIPGPGDLRHCLTVLAGDGSPWSELLEQRLAAPNHPDLEGMAVGNLVIAALLQRLGDIGRATSALAELLGVREHILPVSTEDIHLSATLTDGSLVRGELEVRRPGKAAIEELRVDGAVAGVWPPAAQVLRSASVLVIGPGSLWTSIGGVLTVPGVRQCVLDSGAKIIFVANTTTQPGQTDGLDLAGHVEVLTHLMGRSPDVVVANEGRLYASEEEELQRSGLGLVLPDRAAVLRLEASGARVVRAGLLAPTSESTELWQKLHTAYHDMNKLAEVVATVMA